MMNLETVTLLLLLSWATSFPAPRRIVDQTQVRSRPNGNHKVFNTTNDQENLFSAIVSLHNVTGFLDQNNTPRCGWTPDQSLEPVGQRRKRRYTFLGSKWGTRVLTYRVVNGPSKGPLSKTQVRNIVAEAFSMWSKVAPLVFKEEPSTKKAAHMTIAFVKREHGDGRAFDGMGNVLAHATSPMYGGDTHFDDDEFFTHNSHRGTSLLQNAAHEFGHALGLGHSKTKGTLMYPHYTMMPTIKLKDDDIKGIQALYGKSRGGSSDRKTTPAVTGKPDKALCRDPNIDAIFQEKGEVIAIKGNLLYLLVDGGVAPGYPQPVRALWPKLQGNIDSVLTANDLSMILIGSQMYFIMQDQHAGLPRAITTTFKGAPSNVDAAGSWNGYVYFFKGDKYWTFDSMTLQMTRDSPKPLSTIKGYDEAKVDSVLIHEGRLYFFRGPQHYIIDPVTLQVVNAKGVQNPRPNGPVWFGCP